MRDTPLLVTRMAISALFGAMLSVLFWDTPHDPFGAQSRVALAFITLVYSGYTSMLNIPKIVDLRAVHFREYSARMYRLVPYFASITVAEFPAQICQSMLYVLCYYFFTGLDPNMWTFVKFSLCNLLLAVTCNAFSGLMAVVCPNGDTAMILNTVLNAVFMLFCGFLIPYDTIPTYWRWLYYLSMFRYPLSFLVTNEMLDEPYDCGEQTANGLNGGGSLDNQLGGSVPIFVGGKNANHPPFPYSFGVDYNFAITTCPLDQDPRDSNPGWEASGVIDNIIANPYCFRWYCPVQNGNFILERFSFPLNDFDMWINLAYLAVFYVGIRALTLLCIKYVQHIKR